MYYDSHSLSILRQSKELGASFKLAGNWTMASPQFRKSNEALFEGVLCTSPSFYLDQSGSVIDFLKRFETAYARAPSAYAAIGCDMAGIIRQAATDHPIQLIESIKKLKAYKGIIGELSASPHGELEISLYPAEIKNGKTVRTRR